MSGGCRQYRTDVLCAIGRVEQNQVERVDRRRSKGRRQTGVLDGAPVRQPAVGYITPDERDRSRIPLDEQYVAGASTQRFDTDGPGAGAAIEHSRAFDGRAQDIEQCPSKPVRGGAQSLPVG